MVYFLEKDFLFLERILDIAIQFAWGLHYAHEKGLIHQDAKSANVIMTPSPFVADLGILDQPRVSHQVPHRLSSRPPPATPGAGSNLRRDYGGRTDSLG